MIGRKIVEDVFTKPLADQIWTANALTVFPVTPQDVPIGSLLPAVMYMFRWGHRRGRGKFMQTFGPGAMKPNIFCVAGKLTDNNPDFATFDTEVKKNILGDLLLCYVLENKAHREGQSEEVQRVYPTHYMSSWIDLPNYVAHLRFVPEMLVALLAEQEDGRVLRPSELPLRFSVALGFNANILLKVLGAGVTVDGPLSNLAGDRLDENTDYAIDQLLTIRLAQMLGQAPERARGAGTVAEIPNSWSVAQLAAARFRTDLSIFLQAYGHTIPRLTLVPMFDCLVGSGLVNLFLECLASAVFWEKTGRVIPKAEQKPSPLFVDASNGSDHQLRRFSEESLEGACRLVEQAQTALMCIRILDAKGRADRTLRDHVPKGPDSSAWLDLLGDVRLGRHGRSDAVLNDLGEKCESMAELLEREHDSPELVEILRSPAGATDPVGRLADAIVTLFGDKNQRTNYMKFLDSCLLVGFPHGLGRKRRVPVRSASKGRTTTDVRSIVLSNTLLDALVHRHICHLGENLTQRPLAFAGFLRVLREQYGYFVDQSPPGLSVSSEDLGRNRQVLERRLTLS